MLIEPDYKTAEAYCARIPRWARKENSTSVDRFALIMGVLGQFKPESMAEVGVSSGTLSGALLFKSSQYCGSPSLCAIDFGERVYYDENHGVGDACKEGVPELGQYYKLNTGVTALDIDELTARKFGFVYIDANHSHPWAAIDCLCLLPHLKDDAIIGFHDTAQGHSRARSGVYTYSVLNLDKIDNNELDHFGSGFCRYDGDQDKMLESLLDAFSLPWQVLRDNGDVIEIDAALNDRLLAFIEKHFGAAWEERFARCFERAIRLSSVVSASEASRENRLLMDMRASIGWKATAPFRWVRRLAGK